MSNRQSPAPWDLWCNRLACTVLWKERILNPRTEEETAADCSETKEQEQTNPKNKNTPEEQDLAISHNLKNTRENMTPILEVKGNRERER